MGAIERMGCIADRLSTEWELDDVVIEKTATATAMYRHASGAIVMWSAEPGHTVQLWDADGDVETWLDDEHASLDAASEAVQTCIEMVDYGTDQLMPPQASTPRP
ncbi:hypothetical protein HUG10_21110 (plasmid) [Halorarum halophilum]|uniref:Uncharacterized protein n=1 Tax=Halorarum halophilum TaxID=2743090 RepID=A0A7D5GHW1_9EURY|nr:hypothetical protein [Halobaculum halophilum]QLG30088.1 hypothetical protein HUG10_21110 [Halobaculum halophilum]